MRLADAVPELAAWIDAGLTDQGRHELRPIAASIVVHRVDASTNGASLDAIPGLDPRTMMEHPGRERIWIGRPRGVRRRSWGVTLEIVEGTVWHVGVAHPGILRPTFEALARKLR